MRTCLFCDRTSLTREHVWLDWISKFLFGQPKKGRFTATRFDGPGRVPVGTPFRASELNHKARVVCAVCNNGWMSEVEQHAARVRGDTLTLNTDDQAALIAWIVLRALVLERSGASPSARPFYTDDERRTFADIEFEGSLEPIDGTYIWAFQYRSPQWAARSNVLNGGIHIIPGGSQTHRVQVVTGFIGRFGFQVLVGRWPKRRRLELRSRAVREWEPATALLWPHRDDAFVDRFVKGGFPLEGRR